MKKFLFWGVLFVFGMVLTGCEFNTGGSGAIDLDEEWEEDVVADDVEEDEDEEEEEIEANEEVDPTTVNTFEAPPFEATMKSRCGASVDFRYCKCSFHGEKCGELGLSKDAARSHLQSLFDDYADELQQGFQETCETGTNTIWNSNAKTCSYCPEGSVVESKKCIIPPSPEEEEEVDEDDELDEDSEEGECKVDWDCDAICEGDVYRKMGCSGRTDTCEKTFETDCFAERTSVGSFEFAKLCTLDGCIDDKTRVATFRNNLSADALKFQNLMQEVERARVQAHNNCLSALSDVTNKFIIDSAIMFAGVAGLRVNTSYQSAAEFSKYVQPSGSAVEAIATAQVTGPVQQLLDKLGSMAIDDGTPKMKVEDYIDLNCNAAKDLAAEHARLAVERDVIIELAKPLKGW